MGEKKNINNVFWVIVVWDSVLWVSVLWVSVLWNNALWVDLPIQPLVPAKPRTRGLRKHVSSDKLHML